MAFENLLNISAKLISFGLKSFRIRHFKCNIVEVQLNIMNGPCDEITIRKERKMEAFLKQDASDYVPTSMCGNR